MSGRQLHILRIEHPVPDYGAWKVAFDKDPMGRARSGVSRYRIFRPTDDPHYVMVDLEFDNLAEAEAMHTALRGLWGRVEGKLIERPKAWIIEVLEATQY